MEILSGNGRFDPGHVSSLVDGTKLLGAWVQTLSENLAETGSIDRVGRDVEASYRRLHAELGSSPDVILRRFVIDAATPVRGLLAFVDGMVDNSILDRDTVLMMEVGSPDLNGGEAVFEAARARLVTAGHVEVECRWSKLIAKLLLGTTLTFVDGVDSVLLVDTVRYTARSVSRPQSEPSVKGPQEAFNEISLTQLNLVRRHLPTEDLVFDQLTVGTHSRTAVTLCYLRGTTNPALVAAVRHRLEKVYLASVETSNQIAEYLTDRRLTIFPQVRSSERVDLVVRSLTQGKVAVLVANDPFALTLPNTLVDFYQTTQDYAFPFWDGTLMRIIRLIGLAIGLYLMPLYIALSSVNPDLFPVKLMLTVAGSREGIPFPPVAEVVIMWLIIEILREAANRLPQQLATTIGTVGAVVVGTAIVKAGVVDTIMIIAVTLTALGFFTTPTFELATTWRWIFWIVVAASWVFGIYGIVLITVAIIVHLTSLENYGVPYLSPFGPVRPTDLADSFVRFPFPDLIWRPSSLRTLSPRQAQSKPAAGRVRLNAAQRRFRQ